MQHKRWSSVGDDPQMLSSTEIRLFLSEAELNAARDHVEESRAHTKANPSRRTSTSVPGGALDECRDSHHAAQERADEDNTGKYKSKGLMAMVCRHDIPIFLCDIQTPGERQYFGIALIRKLASLLPSDATIGVLYDIACQMDRSVSLVCPSHIIPCFLLTLSRTQITSTTSFRTSLHAWSLQ